MAETRTRLHLLLFVLSPVLCSTTSCLAISDDLPNLAHTHVVVKEVERFLPIHTLLLQQPLIGGRELLQQLECFLLLEKDEGSSISAAARDSRTDRRRHNMPQDLFSC